MRGPSFVALGLLCLVGGACNSPGTNGLADTTSESGTGTSGDVGDSSESESAGDSGSEVDTGGDSDTDTDTDTRGDGDGDTAGDGDTGGDGDGESTGDGDGDGVCTPEDEPLVAQFSLEPTPATDLSETCTVTGSSSAGNETTIEFNCSGTERTLVIQSSIDAPNPSQDAQLVINYRRAPAGLGQSRWLTLANPTSGGQSNRFGMIDASALAPPDTTALEFFFPLDLQPTNQRCPSTEDDCGVVSPLVVELGTTDGPLTQVAQGQIEYFNVLPWGAETAMAQASQREQPVLCDDLPEIWYQAAIRYEYGP